MIEMLCYVMYVIHSVQSNTFHYSVKNIFILCIQTTLPKMQMYNCQIYKSMFFFFVLLAHRKFLEKSRQSNVL